MAYGNYSYGGYSQMIIPPSAQPVQAADDRNAALKAALTDLLKGVLEEPAELLAPQEGPAIGHLGGE